MQSKDEKGFINCLRCGLEIEQNIRGSRKYCPSCAEIVRLERQQEVHRRQNKERLEREKESSAIKKLASQTEKSPFLEAQRKADAELDARSAKQRKQCEKCKYQLRQVTNNKPYCSGCDYISWKKHSRDKGNGPGDCRSFAPLDKAAKEERKERQRKALRESEANSAHLRGEKLREVNS
jgi:predicted RNA-binding Zn-ribbon protein involved in translation (DUF1610 family)